LVTGLLLRTEKVGMSHTLTISTKFQIHSFLKTHQRAEVISEQQAQLKLRKDRYFK
jgi:hypothetical protein